MLFNASPEVITLENRSECDVALGIVQELPQPGRPCGENYLFLTPDTTAQIPSGRILHGLRTTLRTATYRPCPRRENTPNFSPVALTREQSSALGAASFIVSGLGLPKYMSPLVIESAQKSIDNARLMSALIVRNEVAAGIQPGQARQIVRRLEAKNNTHYARSISAAASRLLRSVRDECAWVIDRTPPVVLDGQPRGQALKSAIATYKRNNSVLINFVRGDVIPSS